jgi:hypothetical protein
VAIQLVFDGVDVLKDDGIERRQVLAEQLVDGEGDERELAVGRLSVRRVGVGLVCLRAEDEERDDVEGRVALQPRP